MAVCPAVLFLSLLFEYDDFLRAILLDDRSLDDCIRKHRQAKLDVTVVLDKQDILYFQFGTEIAGRFLQPNRLSGRYTVLLSARSDHGIHSRILLDKDKQSLYMKNPLPLGEGLVVPLRLRMRFLVLGAKVLEADVRIFLCGP